LLHGDSEERRFYRGLKACKEGREPGAPGNSPLLTIKRLLQFMKIMKEKEKKGISVSVGKGGKEMVCVILPFIYFPFPEMQDLTCKSDCRNWV
jgi:hypothetical protein